MQKIFKGFFILLIAAVCGLLLFRIYTVNHFPKATTETVVTDKLAAALAAHGRLTAYTWDIPINYDDPQAPNFFCAAPVYFPDAKCLQITLRCKLRQAASLGFDEDGDAVAVLFDDMGNASGAVTSTYAQGYGLYAYRRFVFEDVDLADCNYLRLSVFLKRDITSLPIGSLAVYESNYPQKTYNLSARERAALQN